MRILALTLAIACSFGVSVMGAGTIGTRNDTGDPIQALLDRVGKMKTSEQQAWLRRLEQRASYAARITLKPDELAQQQAKLHAKLHQKTVTWQILRELIADTDKLERDAVAQLVRRYRDLVFDAFHQRIETYNQRQQAWLDVFSDWKSAGHQFDQQDRLINWLEAAIRSATPNAIGPIPEKPKFEPLPPPEKPASKQPTEPSKSAEPAKATTPEQPKPEAAQPPAKADPKPSAEPTKPAEPSDKSAEKPDKKASK